MVAQIFSKNYYAKFGDGSVWAVPMSTIAELYAFKTGGSMELLLDDNKSMFTNDTPAIVKWVKSNVAWVDVSEVAVQIKPPTPIEHYGKSWLDAEVKIV